MNVPRLNRRDFLTAAAAGMALPCATAPFLARAANPTTQRASQSANPGATAPPIF